MSEKITTLYNCSHTKQVIFTDAKRVMKDKECVGVEGTHKGILDGLGAIEVSDKQAKELKEIYPFLGTLKEQEAFKDKMAKRKSGADMKAENDNAALEKAKAQDEKIAALEEQIAELVAAAKK